MHLHACVFNTIEDIWRPKRGLIQVDEVGGVPGRQTGHPRSPRVFYVASLCGLACVWEKTRVPVKEQGGELPRCAECQGH